jgi:hypothetical protein
MKYILTAVAIAFLFAQGCKKKEDKPNNTQTGTTTGGTTTGGTTTGGTTGGTTSGATTGGPVITTTATTFHGFMTAQNFSIDMNGISLTDLQASAYFYSVAVSFNTGAGVRAGTVTLNGDSLSFQSTVGNYYSTKPLNQSQQVWQVSGDNTIPAFTFSSGLLPPSADNLHLIPKTISKSAGLNFSITNLKNYNSGVFVITDGTSSSSGTIFQSVTGTAHNVAFSSSNLAALATGTTGLITFQLMNEVQAATGGKDFKFSNDLIVSKSVTITP